MGIVAWLDSVTRLRSGSARPYLKELLTPEQFQHAAMCERMRVDRNGSVLSVLTVELPARRASPEEQAAFVATLQSRLRITDSVGRLHDGKFGILLPDTPESGAWKVAADLCEPYVPGSDRPRCEVLVYPAPDGGEPQTATDEVDPDAGVAVGEPASGEAFFVLPMSRSKRAIDILGASIGLVLAAPTLLLAAIAIRCTSPGGVLYKQEREGLGGKRFMILKLRTMCAGADQFQKELRHRSEQDGPAFKLTDDPRVTWLGKWLRKTSIDELPQLWNVLRGEMSLVGPRPLPTQESQQCSAWQRQRLQVMPGLTCIWQIQGRNIVPFDEWIRMDLRYVRQRNVWYDLQLVAHTLPAILFRRGPR